MKKQNKKTAFSIKQLYKANRDNVPNSFRLKVRDSDNILFCDEIIRFVPTKRIVSFGTWGDKPVVAKLFFNKRKAAQQAKSDREGVSILVDAGIPTPKLLYQGSTEQQRIHILIFERIMNSSNVEMLWKDNPDFFITHAALMNKLMLELATQHVLGIRQHDMHLKNILIAENQIYTLDGENIDSCRHPLNKKQSLEHLALFFAQFGMVERAEIEKLFNDYTEARSWIVHPEEILDLHQMIEDNIKARLHDFQKKLHRNCTAFAKLKSLYRYTMYDREYHSKPLLALLKNPESAFKQSPEYLKKGNSTTIVKTTLNDKEIVIKRYNVKNAWHWFRRCFRKTRAVKNWELAQLLQLVGVATAKPIAFIEKRFFGLRGPSYLLMEYVSEMHAGDYFSQYRENDDRFKTMAKKIALLFENLQRLHLTHGDLKMTNILIQHHHPVLIDLDGMQRHLTEHGVKLSFKKDLERFMLNWYAQTPVYELFQQVLK